MLRFLYLVSAIGLPAAIATAAYLQHVAICLTILITTVALQAVLWRILSKRAESGADAAINELRRTWHETHANRR